MENNMENNNNNEFPNPSFYEKNKNIIFGLLIVFVLFILYNMFFNQTLNCQDKVAMIENYYKENYPDIALKSILNVYKNNENTCSFLSVYADKNKIDRLASKAFEFDSDGNIVKPLAGEIEDINNLTGAYDDNIRKIVLSARGEIGDGHESISLYRVNNNNKQKIPVFENLILTKDPQSFIIDLPEEDFITLSVFENNNHKDSKSVSIDHNTMLDVLDLITIPKGSKDLNQAKSIKSSLIAINNQGNKFDVNFYANDKVRADIVKSGYLKWGQPFQYAAKI